MRNVNCTGLAVLVGATLLAAGCGSSSSTNTTSASTPTAADGSGAAGGAQLPPPSTAALFKFASCMQAHGVSNFPDPGPQSANPSGSPQPAFAVPKGLASSPQFATAAQDCRSIIPQPSPAQIAAAEHQRELDALGFSECMRNHHVSGFPDPTAQGRLTGEMVTAAGIDLHAPAVISAAYACIPASHGAITAAAIQRAVHGT